jgi:hypothetical protein
MRHSDPKLTANVYTDPKLLDVRGSLDALPSLWLDAGPTAGRERARASGTETYSARKFAPEFALTGDKQGQTTDSADKNRMVALKATDFDALGANAVPGKEKAPLTVGVNGPLEYARQDLNLQPLAPECKDKTFW